MLIVVAIVLVLASIAVISARRSRMSANEAAAIQDVRDALAGQEGNPAEIAGGPLRCNLLRPDSLGTKSGYVRGCANGVYWARPEVQGRTGERGFATDGSGRICVTKDGSIPTMGVGCEGLR